MLAPPDTPHRSGRVYLNDQAAVVFDRKCVGGVDDRCGSGLLDGGGTVELVRLAVEVFVSGPSKSANSGCRCKRCVIR